MAPYSEPVDKLRGTERSKNKVTRSPCEIYRNKNGHFETPLSANSSDQDQQGRRILGQIGLFFHFWNCPFLQKSLPIDRAIRENQVVLILSERNWEITRWPCIEAILGQTRGRGCLMGICLLSVSQFFRAFLEFLYKDFKREIFRLENASSIEFIEASFGRSCWDQGQPKILRHGFGIHRSLGSYSWEETFFRNFPIYFYVKLWSVIVALPYPWGFM